MASIVVNDIERRVWAAYLSGKTVKLLLLDTSAVEDKTVVFVSEVTADELSDASYERQTIASVAVSVVNIGGSWYIKIDGEDALFNNLDAGTIGMGVVFVEITNDADSPVIAYLDPPDQPTDGDPIEFRFNVNGIFYIPNGAV